MKEAKIVGSNLPLLNNPVSRASVHGEAGNKEGRKTLSFNTRQDVSKEHAMCCRKGHMENNKHIPSMLCYCYLQCLQKYERLYSNVVIKVFEDLLVFLETMKEQTTSQR